MRQGRPSSASRPSSSSSRKPGARRPPQRGGVLLKLLGAVTAVATAVTAIYTTRSSPEPATPSLAAEVAAPAAPPITPSAGGPPITNATAFCERYLNIYCEIDDESAEPRQLDFTELLPDQQRLVRQQCERAATAAAPAQLQAMAACLDCINDCSYVLLCLEGDQPCRDREGLYE